MLSVYLDSSDFSVLSDPARQSDGVRKIGRALRDFAEKNGVVYSFSAIHVLEAAPIATEHINAAKRRFRLIHDLCGANCLSYPTELIADELHGVAGRLSPPARLRRDDGKWFPDIDWDFPSLDELARNALREVPKNLRARASSLLFTPRGDLTAKARTQLALQAPALLANLTTQYPLTPKAQEAIRDYLVAGGSTDVLIRGIERSIADLSVFGDWYVANWEKAGPLASPLRENGRRMKETLEEMARRIASLAAHRSKLPSSAELERLFREQRAAMPGRIAGKVLDAGGVASSGDLTFSWEQTPSLMAISYLIAHVARQSSLAQNATRAARASDLGDVAHAMYLPHVDIFRADGFVANAIQEAKLPFSTTVVAKLTNLPAAIESRIRRD